MQFESSNTVQMQPLEGRLMMAVTPVPLSISTGSTALGTELRIAGTTGADNISIGRTTSGLLIKNSTGWSTTWTGSFSSIRINGLDGNDRIAVGSTVCAPVAIYG